MFNQKGQTSVEVIAVLATALIFLLVIGLVIFSPFIGGSIHYSNGTRVGEIVKFSQRGFFIKNWCGEMSIGGQGQAGYLFDFGIDRNQNDKQLIDKLSSLEGQRVEVVYDQRGAENPFNGCNDYLITSVKAIK